MNYGLYLSAAGVTTNMYRQEVYANNLANVETAAFKPDVPSIKQRQPASFAADVGMDQRHALLERLGGGTHAGPQWVDFTPGSLQQTGNPLDVALPGQGDFFAVQTGDGVKLTRDGRFERNEFGELVTVSGHRVLGEGDAPVVVPEVGDVRIDGRGRVLVDGVEMDRVQVARVAELGALRKEGMNLFGWVGGDPRMVVDEPRVQPEHVEASRVQAAKALMNMIDASKAVAGNAELIRYQDMMMDRAVNTLGRIA